ncbi:hypothetical protein ABLN86_05940 [Mycobacterium tuberculosis]
MSTVAAYAAMSATEPLTKTTEVARKREAFHDKCGKKNESR